MSNDTVAIIVCIYCVLNNLAFTILENKIVKLSKTLNSILEECKKTSAGDVK